MDAATANPASDSAFVELAAEIVSAYVSNNSVPTSELPALIASVHASLAFVANSSTTQSEQSLQPPVPIKSTVKPDYILSLEDGRKYKSMKRHLTGRGLTPQQYREKWGLRPDYPMVAPNYSKARSEMARSMGLGQKMAAGRKKSGKARRQSEAA
jgi:predicted transcriptional regulator